MVRFVSLVLLRAGVSFENLAKDMYIINVKGRKK